MQKSTLFVVEVDETISEYAQKLATLIEAQGIDVKSCTLDVYKESEPLADIMFGDGAKFIFVGADSSGQSAAPKISSWQYELFGCRIGWSGYKCAIFARDTELPYSDYKDFRKYCKGVRFDHPDVVIPPESTDATDFEWVNEGYEWAKNFFTDKKNRPAHQAQYSTLVYEFVDHFLDPFMKSEERGGEENANDADVPKDMKDVARDLKAKASVNLTNSQALWCHAIIHTASIACAAVAFVPVPVVDTIPITGAQVSMVLGLGKVFDNEITKSDAQMLLKTLAAPLAGRLLSKAALALVPGVGWAINGAIAGAITETLGWTIVNDFVLKSWQEESGAESKDEASGAAPGMADIAGTLEYAVDTAREFFGFKS
jgi:uncharacterized protein (DUF697 family)